VACCNARGGGNKALHIRKGVQKGTHIGRKVWEGRGNDKTGLEYEEPCDPPMTKKTGGMQYLKSAIPSLGKRSSHNWGRVLEQKILSEGKHQPFFEGRSFSTKK